VDNLSKLIAGTEYPDLPLEKIIIGTAGRAEKTPIFNAAQTWNHTFYLKSMRSKGGGEPPAALKQKMEASFFFIQYCTERDRLWHQISEYLSIKTATASV
jgi:Fe-Mn family superoxide dismutase